jgi:hypothetical protein
MLVEQVVCLNSQICLPLLRDRVQELGQIAADAGGIVPAGCSDEALVMLSQHNLVHQIEDGQMVLASEALLTGVVLAEAAPVNEIHGTPVSAFHFRASLLRSGWTFSRKTRPASVSAKRMKRHNVSSYFELLYNFGDAALFYEADGIFSHSQGHGFYRAVEAAIMHFNQEVQHVPKGKTADFYAKLLEWFAGRRPSFQTIEFSLFVRSSPLLINKLDTVVQHGLVDCCRRCCCCCCRCCCGCCCCAAFVVASPCWGNFKF